MTENLNNAAAILQAGSALSEVRHVGPYEHPYVVVPEGYEVKSLEKMLNAPRRSSGEREFFDADSFIAFVNEVKHGHLSSTRVYGRLAPSPKFVAVFNDDAAHAPGFRDFRANYNAPLSVEWTTWSKMDGQGMNQENFASFVEKNLPDVIKPAAADFLEISRTLEAKKAVNFKSAIRLSDGKNQFTYEEDIKGTASNGRLEIPESFAIGIPVLEGGPRYQVEAKLRYRIKEGNLVLWYELVRPHKIVEDAAKGVKQYIAEGIGLAVLNGAVGN